ncbi:MAG: glycosyltransferase family 2 protein, partial [Selenomonadaceae bacterium]|nr:glycosyltransferase family 2 protein [Selenomonadaceae bacterium]
MSETKISVIIPLYNAEKFIRKCLISVLSSKFKDYEVLVVDDCSTDSSVAEAEKLLPHFEGRLKILSTEKNSGGPGIPRNVGIKNSAGKYITFVDNDDFLLPTALGDFFELAEKFSADVIHTEKCLIFNDKGDVNFTWNEISAQSDEPHDEFVGAPFMESRQLDERIRRYLRGKFFWLPWGKFFRRDFLTENKLDFPQMNFSEDM